MFAREAGSVAAPTAGLHFTPELLDALDGARRCARRGGAARRRRNVQARRGGRSGRARDARGVVSSCRRTPRRRSTRGARRADASGPWARRAFARSRARPTTTGVVRAGDGETRIFIRPPYRFRAVDRLVTNFHLPRSTLIMLVAAFAGYDLTMRAYRDGGRRAVSLLFVRRRDGSSCDAAVERIEQRRERIRVLRSSTSLARRAPGRFATPHGVVETPAFMAVGTLATVKALDPDDLTRAGRADDPRQRLSSASAARRRAHSRVRRAARVHGMGRPDPHRLRRLSGVLARGAAHGERRRRRVPQPHRRLAARCSRPRA